MNIVAKAIAASTAPRLGHVETRWIAQDGTFNTAQIMRDAHSQANRLSRPARNRGDRAAYREAFAFYLAQTWAGARSEREKLAADIERDAKRFRDEQIAELATPFDADIADLKTQIMGFDMSCRHNFASPEMARMRARLGKLQQEATAHQNNTFQQAA